MNIELTGCAPTPLVNYLKALGVLRLVAEQKDSDVRGYWQGTRFLLEAAWGSENLEQFLLYEYRPTPITAPWNGGSGYYPKDNRDYLDAVRGSKAERLQTLRQTIERAYDIVDEMQLRNKPSSTEKNTLLLLCRNRFPDVAVQWLDAAVVLTDDGLKLPPLLGTGGNDGRFEFTTNFLKHLIAVMNVDDGRPTVQSAGWLEAALWGACRPAFVKGPIGQFHPGLAGGPNSRQGFDGEGLVNPWDYLLALEGALMFAAHVTYRLGTHAQWLSYPFTVASVGAGEGSLVLSDEQSARAEMWLPIWERPATFGELSHVLAEGRVRVGKHRARSGLDFSRACVSLGVDRGITAFQRYGFLKRAGKSYLATPLERVSVARNRRADILTDLNKGYWLEKAQRYARTSSAPTHFQKGLSRVESLMMTVYQKPSPAGVQKLLAALGQLNWMVSRSKDVREHVPPIRLSSGWIASAYDGTWPFRVALGIASIWHPQVGGFRQYMTSVNEEGEWDSDGLLRTVWIPGKLLASLVQVLHRRLMDWARLVSDDHQADRTRSPGIFDGLFKTSLSDVLAFIAEDWWDDRIESLLYGLSLVDFRHVVRDFWEEFDESGPIPLTYQALRLLLTTNLRDWIPDKDADPLWKIPSDISGLLKAGRIAQAAEDALRQLSWRGYASGFHGRRHGPLFVPEASRLSAALIVPLSRKATVRMAERLQGVALDDM